ncbi:MAG TPA: PaaI family thioesterase [Fontimonas sp.]
MKQALIAARARALETSNFDALLQLIPYARFLGVSVEIHDGQLRSVLAPSEHLIGSPRLPALHGGVTAAFMENAALLHLLMQPDLVRIPKSIDFSLDYLRPARLQTSYAQCEVTRAGARAAQVQIRCWQSSPAEPIAIGRGHFLLLSSKAE